MAATPGDQQNSPRGHLLAETWRCLREMSAYALALAADHVDLFTLEIRSAVRGYCWALAGALAAMLLLLIAWGCMVAGLVLSLLSAGWSPAVTFLVVAGTHGGAGLIVGALALRRLRQPVLADTRRLLRMPLTRPVEGKTES